MSDSSDDEESRARRYLRKYFLQRTTVSTPPRKDITTPKKMKKQSPQEVVDEFWTKFNTKTPGKASTVLPADSYAKKISDANQKKSAHGKPASASYEDAVRICKLKVEKISKECRRLNQKYRDPHFDIEFDLKWGIRDTLETLAIPNRKKSIFKPGSVKRVGDIFEKPVFFKNGTMSAKDIRQGQDGDCWLMAALCALTNKPGLIERICVARDEAVGVYGFVFYRDSEWRSEIIDDKLFLTRPDYDESVLERVLWEDRERVHSEDEYRKTYQTGSGALYFAQCEDPNETWLPLLEKAYAKAHGDFAAIEGGFTGEGVEDLTGGITVEVFATDILDKEEFWKNELLRVNEDFLFGCAASVFRGWGERKGIKEGHAYSIMRAVEIDGQRLCLLQNPWGKGEWTGAWSDGSKEWTAEWMTKLNHRFGNDGAFWISYQDLLRKYQTFDRTRLFDDSWSVTHQWATLRVEWSGEYHDTKFAFTINKPSSVVIVLNQLNTRYFKGLSGQYTFELGFRLHRAGEEDYIVRSRGNYCMERSVSAEVDLEEAGEYFVLIKVKATRDFTALPVETVIRENAKTRRDKLLRIGLAYDLAHAKGQLEETPEEKALKEKAEARRKAKERAEHKTKLKEEKKERKKSLKKKAKREKAAAAKAAAKQAKQAAKNAKKEAEEAKRNGITIAEPNPAIPIGNAGDPILRPQEPINMEDHSNCEQCNTARNAQNQPEQTPCAAQPEQTPAAAEPEQTPASAEPTHTPTPVQQAADTQIVESTARTETDSQASPPELGPSRMVTFDLPLAMSTPGSFPSSNVSDYDSGSVRNVSASQSTSSSIPQTRRASIASLSSRRNDITPQLLDSVANDPQFQQRNDSPPEQSNNVRFQQPLPQQFQDQAPLSPEARELFEVKRQVLPTVDEDDSDSGSEVSSVWSSVIEESIARANKPPPSEPAQPPANKDEKKKEDEEDEFEKDPWNAVCVVGLRVYAKALKARSEELRKMTNDSATNQSNGREHLCGSIVGEIHGDEGNVGEADEDDAKGTVTPTSEDEEELGSSKSTKALHTQSLSSDEKKKVKKSDLVEVTIRVVRPHSWEDGEASLDVDDSAMDATKNVDGDDKNRKESVMGMRGRLGSTVLNAILND